MNLQLGLFLLGTFLFIICWEITLSSPPPNWWELPRVEGSILRESYESNQIAELIRSYTTGIRRRLPRAMRVLHQDLGLMHLLTPSGLHLSVLWKLFFPGVLLIFGKMGKQKLSSLCSGLLCLSLWSFDQLMAMQRMALFRFLASLIPKMTHKILTLFFLTFVFSFLFGNFKNSPLSFALSFLFFGQILFCQHSIFKLSAGIVCSQALIQSLFYQPFSILGALFGVLLTPLFVFLFPLMLFDYWVLARFSSLNLEFIFGLYYGTLEFFHQLSHLTSYTLIDSTLAFSLAFIGLTNNKTLRLAGCLLLLLSTKPLINLPARAHLKEVQVSYENRHPLYFEPQNIERTPRGYKTWNEKELCYHRLLISKYERSCRQK